MATYKGKLSGQQIDRLPELISRLEQLINALEARLKELEGIDPQSSSAQSSAIDSVAEIKAFLSKVNNTKTIEDVVQEAAPDAMSESDLNEILDGIK